MDVTIIGAGNMGRGIGTRLLSGGNRLRILDTDPDQAQELVEALGEEVGDSGAVEAGAAGDPLTGDVIVLAVWYEGAQAALGQYGEQLSGKIVVDVSNPVDVETFDGLVTPSDSSAAEELAKKAPQDAKVVKAFNTTFAGTLVQGKVADQPLDVFIAGDDDDAKRTIAELARSGDLNPIDAGPLRRARELERLGFLHMAIQGGLGTEYGSAVKVVS